jgi:hypothetical protein
MEIPLTLSFATVNFTSPSTRNPLGRQRCHFGSLSDAAAHTPRALIYTDPKLSDVAGATEKIASAGEKSSAAEAVVVSACPVKRNNPLTTAVNGLRLVEPTGLKIPAKIARKNGLSFPSKTGHFANSACPNAAVRRCAYRTFDRSAIGLSKRISEKSRDST